MSRNRVGKPKQFSSPEEMQKRIDEYFADCEIKNEPKTVLGLALELDLTREGLRLYENYPEYVATVKRAKTIVEMDNVVGGMKNRYNAAVTIFNLKHNFGWQDTPLIDQSQHHTINIQIEKYGNQQEIQIARSAMAGV